MYSAHDTTVILYKFIYLIDWSMLSSLKLDYILMHI